MYAEPRFFRRLRSVVMDKRMKFSDVLMERIAQGEALVGIVGLGYVGLPLMMAAAGGGLRVLGFDIDGARVERLNAGQSPLQHIKDSAIAAVCGKRLFEATVDFSRLKEADVIVICVPTPLGRHHEPDLSFVVETGKTIARNLRRGQMIVLESTTFPGTTSEILRPILEAGGLTSGEDFFLAFSPEREDPGNSDFSTSRIPKVVGGDGSDALALAAAFYGRFVESVVQVSSTKTAEAVKITENVFRAVNIALVNELKIVFSRMGIDVFEVIDAAKTKPFGYLAFYPGPGLGGHCIPIDPFYLSWKAREFGINTRFIQLAGEINSAMPHIVVGRVAEVLDVQKGLGLSQARLLIVGVAYKKNVDDMRESPALEIMDLLRARGAKVDYHDPHIPAIPNTRRHGNLAGMHSVALGRETVAAYDMVVIVTDHSAIDWQGLVDAAQIVVDTRNATAKVAGRQGKVFAA
jgi:UDP-N-acetyl-D-glucosamine dehydrogenase